MIKNYQLLDHNFIFQTHDEDELTSNLIHKYGANIDLETVFAYRYLVNPGDIIFDIGANIGWNTVFASFAVTPLGQVFSFEPDSKNFEILKKNIILNVLSNVTTVQKAASNKTEKSLLYLSKENFGNHILSPNYYNTETHTNSVEVDTISIDDFISIHTQLESSKIKLIKIDVEGSESKVLAGASEFFKRHRPYVILEMHPFLMKQCGDSMFDICSFIDKFRYIPCIIEPIDKDKPLFKVNQLSVMDLLNLSKNLLDQCAYKDLLLVPASAQ